MAPTASSPADWSSRAVVTALSPERLAGLIESAQSRTDGVLFTASPAEELDDVGRWHRLKDLAFAGECRAIVAMVNRARPEEREFVADEVGLAIGASSTTGASLVHVALSAAELPGLLEAVEDGALSERHVRAVLRELDRVGSLTVEQRQAVVLLALARFTGEAPGELGRLVERLILQVDLAAAAARERTASKGRRVWFSREADGQAALVATGPAAQIAAIRAALEATLPLHPDDGDDRSRGAREFDLLVDLLTGSAQPSGWQAQIVVPFSTAAGGDLELAEIPGLGPILPATARDLLDQADSLAQVAVDDDGHVIAVGDPIHRPDPQQRPEPEPELQPEDRLTPEPEVATEPAETDQAQPETEPGPEPEAEPTEPVVERWLRAAPPDRWYTQALDQLTAPPVVRDLTGSSYRFPPRLARYLKIRDRSCVFPGCNRLRVDLDHQIPWPYGKTSADNGECLCRRHHRAKHAVFTVTRLPDGSYRWTTRGGWHFHRPPKGF
jgi:hypothetical protein